MSVRKTSPPAPRDDATTQGHVRRPYRRPPERRREVYARRKVRRGKGQQHGACGSRDTQRLQAPSAEGTGVGGDNLSAVRVRDRRVKSRECIRMMLTLVGSFMYITGATCLEKLCLEELRQSGLWSQRLCCWRAIVAYGSRPPAVPLLDQTPGKVLDMLCRKAH